MDENHLLRLKSSDYDILVCSNYQDLSLFNIEELRNYNNIIIIAWSMGVFAAGMLKKYLDNVSLSIAINGTLKPIDDKYGIPETIFAATLNNFNADTREKFYKRMFKDNENLEKFLTNQPKRNAEDQKNELISLQNYIINENDSTNCFDRVIISKYDKIIPAKNQLNYWREVEKLNPTVIEEGHYPFFLWQSFEEIINS
jgi:biotin synthesis protein BioG